MNKQQVKIIIMATIISAFFTLIGTTYAYFQVRIIENQEETSISVTSKVLEVTYVDGTVEFSGATNGYVFPGETIKKYWTIKNTGDDDAQFNIVLKNVTNTFTRSQDWTYQLGIVTDSNLDGIINGDDTINYIMDNPKQFPSTTELITIYENIVIGKEQNENYVLVVHYENSEEDQSIDMNKELIATVDITSDNEIITG